MKKLIFILFCLISFSAQAVDVDDLIKIEYNTDKFFEYCTKQDSNDVMVYSYCVGFYKGLAHSWIMIKVAQDIKGCPIPPFGDFSTKFNSLFYRNQLNTESGTLINVYKTLDTFCNK